MGCSPAFAKYVFLKRLGSDRRMPVIPEIILAAPLTRNIMASMKTRVRNPKPGNRKITTDDAIVSNPTTTC